MTRSGTGRRVPAAIRSLACAFLATALAACAGRAVPEAGPAAPGELPDGFGPGWAEEGVASWYGPGFHGRPTASGEPYDMEGLTAAHRWLPFGTVVRVEREADGRAVEVRINDRGPFAKGRVIDLSRAAARALGLLGPGTGRVRLEVRELPRAPACTELQVGAYAEAANAARARERARAAGLEARLDPAPGGLRRVVVGPFEDVEAALGARRRLGGFLRACSAGP